MYITKYNDGWNIFYEFQTTFQESITIESEQNPHGDTYETVGEITEEKYSSVEKWLGEVRILSSYRISNIYLKGSALIVRVELKESDLKGSILEKTWYNVAKN